MRREKVPFAISTAGILVFLAHFWVGYPANVVLWVIAAILAISSVHWGMRARAQESADDPNRWMPKSASKLGLLILLGLTLSAIFLIVPRDALANRRSGSTGSPRGAFSASSP